MNDLVVRNCLDFNENKIDILIKNGQIEDISDKIHISNIPEIDAGEHFVTSPFVDSHFHMDATLSYAYHALIKVELSWKVLIFGAN